MCVALTSCTGLQPLLHPVFAGHSRGGEPQKSPCGALILNTTRNQFSPQPTLEQPWGCSEICSTFSSFQGSVGQLVIARGQCVLAMSLPPPSMLCTPELKGGGMGQLSPSFISPKELPCPWWITHLDVQSQLNGPFVPWELLEESTTGLRIEPTGWASEINMILVPLTHHSQWRNMICHLQWKITGMF